MFGIDLKHTRTNVVGKDGSPFEVVNVLLAGVAFVVQCAGTVALVFSLLPLFFMSWGDGRMLLMMFVTFIVIFIVSFFMLGNIGLYLYRNHSVKKRDENGRFAKVKSTVRVTDNKGRVSYLIDGKVVPSDDIKGI